MWIRGYLGKESDYETAPRYGVLNANLYHERLMDMSARKYSKTQGAFTSVDALWAGQIGYSPYAYSFHDPINFMDPTGLAGQPGPSTPSTPPPMGVAGHPVINDDDREKVKKIEIVVFVDERDPYYQIMKADALDQAAGWQSGARQFLSNQDGIPRRDATSIVAPIRADADIRSKNYLTDDDRRLARIGNAAQSQQGNRGQGVITTPPSPADLLRQMDPLANGIAEGVVQGTPYIVNPVSYYRYIRIVMLSRSATGTTALMRTVTVSHHAAMRMAERGVTPAMIRVGLEKGARYYDPRNGTINYILRNGFASGKDLLLGIEPRTGVLTTVLRGSKLVKKRMVPIP